MNLIFSHVQNCSFALLKKTKIFIMENFTHGDKQK